MNPNGITKIGYDPGANANKLAMVRDGEIVTYALPSSVGLANRENKEGLTLSGIMRPQRTTRPPFRVVFEGVEYLVGPNVDEYTKPIDRLDHDRYTDSSELRATFYAGLYRLVNGGAHQIALAIALPVEVVQDKEDAAQVERGIRKWMIGEHVFSVDGIETVLTITRVRAKIPQPVATWFDWGFDLGGQWAKGKEAARAPTLIIDEGFNTLDVLVVENAKISQRIGGGNTLGMSRAAEELIESLKSRYGLEIELHRANELIKDAINGQQAEIYVGGDIKNVTQLGKQAVRSLETEVDNYLTRSVGKAQKGYKVLLTGGGAMGLSGLLHRRFPEATMMFEPVLANARGLAKMASRPGFLD